MKKHIFTLPGDGVGPEVMAGAKEVLKKIAEKYNHEFTFEEGLIGGAAYDAHGTPLADKTLDRAKNADAILLGAVGGGTEFAVVGHRVVLRGICLGGDIFAGLLLRGVSHFRSLL